MRPRDSRNSESLEVTNNMSARTNRSAKTWLDVGKSNLAASPLTNYLTKPYTRCSEVVPTYYPLDTLIDRFVCPTYYMGKKKEIPANSENG